MFNQYGRSRPNPAGAYGSSGFGQKPQPARPTNQPAVTPANSPIRGQYKPDFLPASNATGSSAQPTNDPSNPAHLQRIKPDAFGKLAPQDQRAALFDQARRQQMSQANQLNYQQLRDPSAALPGGLTTKQRADFKMLQRTNPAAAQKQLMNYQRTSDIRYNKPQSAPQPPSGPSNYHPPSNFNGPRPHFGA